MMQFVGYSDGQKALLAHVKKLTAVRAAHPALRKGSRKALSATVDTIAYQMSYAGDEVVVLVNRGDSPQSISVPAGDWKDQIGGAMVNGTVEVAARGSMVLTH